MPGAHDWVHRGLTLQVFDGDVLSAHTLLYNSQSAGEKALASTARVTRLTPVDFAGHRWTLRFTQIDGPASSADYSSVWLVLFGGTSIAVLLSCLFFNLLNTRFKAWQMARQLTMELRESEEKYRIIFDNEIYAICIFDLETLKLLDVNESYTRLYGYSREELVSGMTIHDITAEHQVSDEATSLAVREGTCFIPLRYHRKKDGTIFPLEIVGGPHMWQGRKVMFALAHDISERRRAEEELKRRNEEMVRFAYTVSHDLKSPLVTIKTFLGYLVDDVKARNEKAQAEDVGYIRNAADKMENLLDELLDLSRIGRKTSPPQEIPLQTVAQSAIDLVSGRLSKAGVKASVTDLPVLLYGDVQRLEELYQNLVDNAVKFMGDQPKPRIEIGALREDAKIALFVRDNGVGIDPRCQKRLFGLFEKMDKNTEGVGMGLAIVKRIVEVHGGEIRAESEGLGKGTTFWFTLAGTRLKDTG